MHFEIRNTIDAPPEKIWSRLTGKSVLLHGGFGILKLEGDIRPRGRIKLWSEANPARAFPLKVVEFQPARLMVWQGGMPFGLFQGVRKFVITPQGTSCQFEMREDYSGALAGMISKSIPDLNPSFAKFAAALKRASEGV